MSSLQIMGPTPFRPVAPEHSCLASRMTTDGLSTPANFEMWYAVEIPVIPAPMMAMSHFVGSFSVVRCSSSECGSVRQYGRVALLTGRICFCGSQPPLGSMMILRIFRSIVDQSDSDEIAVLAYLLYSTTHQVVIKLP